MFTTDNLKTAAIVTGAVFLVTSFLGAGKSKLIQGALSFGAVLGGLAIAKKV